MASVGEIEDANLAKIAGILAAHVEGLAMYAFEVTYKNNKRKHRHRCMACNKVIQPGKKALMVILNKGSKATHAECADTVECGMTWRERFEMWGSERRDKLSGR